MTASDIEQALDARKAWGKKNGWACETGSTLMKQQRELSDD